MKITKKEASIAMKAFPEYTGKKFHLYFNDTVGYYNLNWDGGTRNEYRAVQLACNRCFFLRDLHFRTFLPDNGAINELPAMAPWNNPIEGKRAPLPKGWAVVVHSHFCGKDCGLSIYVNEEDLVKFLPLSAQKKMTKISADTHAYNPSSGKMELIK